MSHRIWFHSHFCRRFSVSYPSQRIYCLQLISSLLQKYLSIVRQNHHRDLFQFRFHMTNFSRMRYYLSEALCSLWSPEFFLDWSDEWNFFKFVMKFVCNLIWFASIVISICNTSVFFIVLSFYTRNNKHDNVYYVVFIFLFMTEDYLSYRFSHIFCKWRQLRILKNDQLSSRVKHRNRSNTSYDINI